MALYHRAGARYFVVQSVFHDNFFNYDSKVNRFNSVKIGPKKDICALWKKAADAYHMPFGMTEHLGASFGIPIKGRTVTARIREFPMMGTTLLTQTFIMPTRNM